MARFFPKKSIFEEQCGNPNQAWEMIKVEQIVKPVQRLDPSTPKPPGHTRFVCISDTHSQLDADFSIPDGDVLIHAGDFTMIGQTKEVIGFIEFLDSLSHPHKVVIAGNHDICFDEKNFEDLNRYWGRREKIDPIGAKQLLDDPTKCTYLEDSEVIINGLRIYGSPWVPQFGRMAFMLQRGPELKEKWDQIPDGIDILVTHGPPLGYGDLCVSKARAGCAHLLMAVQCRVKPKYHVYGHIHEGYGILTNGVTTFINASTANVRYQLKNEPFVFDLPNK